MKQAKDGRSKRGKHSRNNVPVDGALVATIDQAAVMLQLGRVSIYKLLRAGELESRMFGRARRITRASIDRLVNVGSSKKGPAA
jgi:excisionase family DNA binding protein